MRTFVTIPAALAALAAALAASEPRDDLAARAVPRDDLAARAVPREDLAARAVAAASAAVVFVACPVYRDTDAGPKSGCWLAEDRSTGARFDVSRALSKPMIGREILVEGVPGAPSSSCGGTVLLPVEVSVLDFACPEYLLPAEGYTGVRYRPPAEVMQPTDVPRAMPPPPYGPRHFSIRFDLGSDFLRYQYSELILEKAALYAVASGGRVDVTGFADTAGFDVSHRHLAEEQGLAHRRADRVARALQRLKVAAGAIHLAWHDNPAPAGELPRYSLRRVDIDIEP